MSALLIIDVQNDFIENDNIVISGAVDIVDVINKLRHKWEHVILTYNIIIHLCK